ncbi:helix-turn-helix domain-containing protein [Vibrio harveyi]|uniref:helix-turn-helix domain-containing protein n=1 Tax=Vibrio harveyi TaxID=669 RepID=UPI003BB71573
MKTTIKASSSEKLGLPPSLTVSCERTLRNQYKVSDACTALLADNLSGKISIQATTSRPMYCLIYSLNSCFLEKSPVWMSGGASGKLLNNNLYIFSLKDEVSIDLEWCTRNFCFLFVQSSDSNNLDNYFSHMFEGYMFLRNAHPFSTLLLGLLANLLESKAHQECKLISIFDIILDFLEKEICDTKMTKDFQTALKVIRENVDKENLSLEFLAERLFFSRSKTQKIFYENNTTFREEIQRIRTELMCQKIGEDPSASLQDVIELVGYKSLGSADKIFKKLKGVSISKYKKTIKDNSCINVCVPQGWSRDVR